MFYVALRPTIGREASTITVVERKMKMRKKDSPDEETVLFGVYSVVHLQRTSAGASFEEVCKALETVLLRTGKERGESVLLLDITVCGEVFFIQLCREGFSPIMLTVGSSVSSEGEKGLHVSRKDLAGALSFAWGSGRLFWSSALSLTQEFEQQLASFSVEKLRDEKDPRVVFEEDAGREDLALGASCCLWYADRTEGFRPLRPRAEKRVYDPLRL